ncbi:MAG: hypothetical protein D084_Lepto4C00422G0008 [Leptospirillum sp. Group IV 'UBA BS']|nr:MAG: hypothetical protein D084_Lepto4C00422G0008 [Leptospirillum sp. Group IV 'UBA BS']
MVRFETKRTRKVAEEVAEVAGSSGTTSREKNVSHAPHGRILPFSHTPPLLPSGFLRLFRLAFLFLFSWGFFSASPALLPVAARAATDPATVPVTLDTAVSRALSARPDLRAETARVKSAREGVGLARAAEYPQLVASFQTIYGNSLFGFFLFPNYEYEDLNLLTFTLTQDLLDFGKTGSQVDQSRWTYRAEEARKLTLWSQTVRDAESGYFTLLADQHQVRADEKSLDDARLQLARARLRYETGSGIVLDVTRARVNVEAARLALIRSRDQVRTDSVNLAQIMGMRKGVRLVAQEVVRDPNEILAPDPDRDLPVALSRRPEWKEAKANVRAARAGLRNSRSQNYPTLNALVQSFTATIPRGALPFTYIPNNSPYSTFNFGGVLTIPIIAGGAHDPPDRQSPLGPHGRPRHPGVGPSPGGRRPSTGRHRHLRCPAAASGGPDGRGKCPQERNAGGGGLPRGPGSVGRCHGCPDLPPASPGVGHPGPVSSDEQLRVLPVCPGGPSPLPEKRPSHPGHDECRRDAASRENPWLPSPNV